MNYQGFKRSMMQEQCCGEVSHQETSESRRWDLSSSPIRAGLFPWLLSHMGLVVKQGSLGPDGEPPRGNHSPSPVCWCLGLWNRLGEEKGNCRIGRKKKNH